MMSQSRKQLWVALYIFVIIGVFVSVYYQSRYWTPCDESDRVLTDPLPDKEIIIIESEESQEEKYYYEFCSDEKTYPIVLPAVNKTLWLLSYDSSYHPDSIALSALYEDNQMKVLNGRIQVFPSEEMLITVEIYDKVQKAFLSCELKIEGDQSIVLCPKSPANHFSQITESLIIRVTDTLHNSKSVMVSLCRKDIPVPHNVSMCIAYIHDLPDLTSRIVEFIEYHRLIGIDHFTIYFRSPRYREQLTSIYPPSVLNYVHWPGVAYDLNIMKTTFQGFYDQQIALNHCLWLHRKRTRWLGMWDLDEWLSVNTAKSEGVLMKVPEFINEFEKSDDLLVRIVVLRMEFATNAYDPSKLAIEQFHTNRSFPNPTYKLFIRPALTYFVFVHQSAQHYSYHEIKPSMNEIHLAHFINLYAHRVHTEEAAVLGNTTDMFWAIPQVRERVTNMMTWLDTGTIDISKILE